MRMMRTLAPTLAATPVETPGRRRATAIQGALYAAVICGTLYGLAWLRDVPFDMPYRVLAGFLAVASFVVFRRYELAGSWSLAHPLSTGRRVLYAWILLVGVVLLGAYASKYSDRLSRGLLLMWMAATPVALFGLHLLVRGLAGRAVPVVSMRRSAVMVFINDTARELARNLGQSASYDLVGYFDDRPALRTGRLDGLPLLAGTSRAADYVRRHGIQVVFVVLPEHAAERVNGVLDQLSDTTASVYYVPDFLATSLAHAQIGEVEGIPVMEVIETPFYGVDGVVKQLFDGLFASAALTLLAPLLLGIAIAIKLDSPGPVLFQQRRYGLDGEPFWLLKFRSMRHGAPGADERQATRDDDRTTRIGRFLRRTSLDELPQFWNVLRGDMSVVGPRPHTVAHTEYYRRAVKRYMARHKVKPGITAWAQVHGLRGETAQVERMAERVRHDVDYVRHWSLLLDLEIIVRTVVVLWRDRHHAY
jgi:putative colanic acid biosysnthesis UDP-glucose lipid carrier transferase